MNDLLVLGLAIIILYDIQIVKPFSVLNKDYLSLESCNSFRGVFALVVVFHHLAQRTSSGVLFHQFTHVGYLAVAVFFFYSGYGLMKKHMISPRYYEKFLLKRIPSVLFPYIVITAVFWLYYAGTGKVYSAKQMISAFLKGAPIVSFSWYIIAILLFYLCFWLLMLLFRERYDLMIISACFMYILYVLFCHRLGYGSYWYNAAFAFAVGMFWAYKESDISKLLEKFFPIFAVATILFEVVCILGIYIVEMSVIRLVLQVSSACLFSIIVVLFSMKFRIRSKIAHFFGTISLELYMTQGLPIMMFRSEAVYIQNELLWCSIVILSSVVLAIVFHVVFSQMLTYYRKVCIK